MSARLQGEVLLYLVMELLIGAICFRTIWHHPSKFKIRLPFGLEIPLLRIYPIGASINFHKGVSTKIASAIFFSVIVKNKNQERTSGYIKAVYCHPAYLTYMQSTS